MDRETEEAQKRQGRFIPSVAQLERELNELNLEGGVPVIPSNTTSSSSKVRLDQLLLTPYQLETAIPEGRIDKKPIQRTDRIAQSSRPGQYEVLRSRITECAQQYRTCDSKVKFVKTWIEYEHSVVVIPQQYIRIDIKP